ncbi:MAG: hypothetical protein AB9903_27985 [Vulcanimicrobiota bacterium]
MEFTPASEMVGWIVTVKGTNFENTKGTVKFNGTQAADGDVTVMGGWICLSCPIAGWEVKATILNSTIDSCMGNRGGGLMNYVRGNLTLINSNISNCQAYDYGAGIYASSANSIVLNNCTITGNSITQNPGYGGEICNLNSTMTVANSTLSGNTATSGGRIYNDDPGTLCLLNSIIVNNTGKDLVNQGTALYAYFCW